MIFLTIKDIRKAKFTLSLLTINSILFIIFSTSFYPEIFLSTILINYKVINNLELWRLITSMFIHNDISHLLSNMFGLLLFGSYVEHVYKKNNYIFIYLCSGLIGNVFTIILFPLNTISYGASGALFGLIGASFITILYDGDKSLLLIALFYLLYFILSSIAPGINLWAHLFGLLSGLILSYLFYVIKLKLRFQNNEL